MKDEKKLLTKEETERLFNIIKIGDERQIKEAKEILAKKNLGLVEDLANKMKGSKLYEDCYEAGQFALFKAINTYEMDKGTLFSTYACKCIKNEINMMNRKKDLRLFKSLDKKLKSDEEGYNLHEILESNIDIEESYIKKEDNMFLYNALNCLDDREKQIIILSYGLIGRPYKQREIAEIFNISRSYVCRIIEKSIMKMRIYMEKNDSINDVKIKKR